MKVVSATQAKVIILPPDATVPERFTDTYPSPERLQEDLSRMLPANERTFRDFLLTFYDLVIDERQALHRAQRAELASLEPTKLVDRSLQSLSSQESLEKGEVAS